MLRHPYLQSAIISSGIRSTIKMEVHAAEAFICHDNLTCPITWNTCSGCCYWWTLWCSEQKIVVGNHCCKTSKGRCTKRCTDYGESNNCVHVDCHCDCLCAVIDKQVHRPVLHCSLEMRLLKMVPSTISGCGACRLAACISYYNNNYSLYLNQQANF